VPADPSERCRSRRSPSPSQMVTRRSRRRERAHVPRSPRRDLHDSGETVAPLRPFPSFIESEVELWMFDHPRHRHLDLLGQPLFTYSVTFPPCAPPSPHLTSSASFSISANASGQAALAARKSRPPGRGGLRPRAISNIILCRRDRASPVAAQAQDSGAAEPHWGPQGPASRSPHGGRRTATLVGAEAA
jgi:hypothetical protein